MIERGNAELTAGVKAVWKRCFTQEDDRYTEFFFRHIYQPEYGYTLTENGRVASTLCRIPHALMFNGRTLATSMIVGVATMPEDRKKGYMKALMNTVLDACEHSELITLIQAYQPELYEPFGFRMLYRRREYTLDARTTELVTTVGCAYEPSPMDMLRCYMLFIGRFNGFYARDLQYFINYKKEIAAQGGKIVAYYDSRNRIQGYAAILFEEGRKAVIEECMYLNSTAVKKLVSAAMQESRTVRLSVTEAEDLGMIFPDADVETVGGTMVRLNQPELFSRLFNEKVKTVEEAFSLSRKPLNLPEHA